MLSSVRGMVTRPRALHSYGLVAVVGSHLQTNPSHLRYRHMTTTSCLREAAQDPERHPNPQRDAQHDRHKINTDANEYARSGTDDEAAKNAEAAFNPNITNPQEAKKKAGEGNRVNPLDASPANQELSKGTREEAQDQKE